MTQDRVSGCVCASLSLVGQPTPIRPSASPAASSTRDHWSPASVQAPVVAFEFAGPVFAVEDAADADDVDSGIDEFGDAFETRGGAPSGRDPAGMSFA